MKGIIIYKSNYGSTKEYAQWLSEETGFSAKSVKDVKNRELEDYDTIVMGSPIFAGKPLLFSWIQKKWSILQEKNPILFTTSGAAGDDPLHMKNFETFFEPQIKDKLSYYALGGRMIFRELKPFHRFLMNLGKKMEKDPLLQEEMIKDKDQVNRDDLKVIVDHLNNME